MEERSAKRIRIDGPEDVALDPIDDDTDFYSESNSPEKKEQHTFTATIDVQIKQAPLNLANDILSPSPSNGIPGLAAPHPPDCYSRLALVQDVEGNVNTNGDEASEFDVYTPQLTTVEIAQDEEEYLDTQEAIYTSSAFEDPQEAGEEDDLYNPEDHLIRPGNPEEGVSTTTEDVGEDLSTRIAESNAQTGASAVQVEAEREFLELAQANKNDETAEWQLDSSDAESDDSSDSSVSSSNDSNDDDASAEENEGELLDPAEQVRILLQKANEAEDEGSVVTPPRTANEEAETYPPKPDIIVTPNMSITPLGAVDHVMGRVAVIKADVSGNFKVLDTGSALCLEDRKVIGVIAETLGPVRKPLYTVGFSSEADLQECNMITGTQVFYVTDHASFVFTQSLQMTKGTDASNDFDEEGGIEEMEFSDDEKEAEYKKSLKQARKRPAEEANLDGSPQHVQHNRGENRGGRRGQRGHHQPQQFQRKVHPDSTPNTAPQASIRYDDDDDDDMYQPLKRPDNLQELMASGPPALPRMNRGDFRRDGGRRGHFAGNGPHTRGGFGGPDRGRRGRGGKAFGGRHEQDHFRQNRGRDSHRGRGNFNSPRPSSSNYSQSQQGQPTQPQEPQQKHQKRSYNQEEGHQQTRPKAQNPQTYSHRQEINSRSPSYQGRPHETPYTPSPHNPTPYAPPQTRTPPALPAGAHVNPAFLMLQNLIQSAVQPNAGSPPIAPNPLAAFQQHLAAQQAQPPQPPAAATAVAQMLAAQPGLAGILQQYQQALQTPRTGQVQQHQPHQPQPQQQSSPVWQGYGGASSASANQGAFPQHQALQPPYAPSVARSQGDDQDGRDAQERLRLLVENLRGQGSQQWGAPR
jgi:H/ACA ribonucleoprotein complex non-core subunit NAF1